MKKITLVSSMLVLALVGCEKKDEPTAASDAAAKPSAAPSASAPATTASASATPTASASAAAKPPPAWMAKMPAKPVTAKVGELVWGVRPFSLTNEGAWMQPHEVTAVSGNTATLRELSLMASGPDSWKHKPNPSGTTYPGIPGAVILPMRDTDTVKPKPGDLVFAGLTNANAPELIKVGSVEGGLVSYEKLNALGTTLEKAKVHYVEPYGTGLAPFTYAAVKDGEEQKLVLVLSVDGDTVVGKTFDNVETFKKADLKPLKAPNKERKKGDKVLAFNSGGKGTVTTISDVPMAKWYYKAGVFSHPWNLVFDAP
jgi:hypothetical protein